MNYNQLISNLDNIKGTSNPNIHIYLEDYSVYDEDCFDQKFHISDIIYDQKNNVIEITAKPLFECEFCKHSSDICESSSEYKNFHELNKALQENKRLLNNVLSLQEQRNILTDRLYDLKDQFIDKNGTKHDYSTRHTISG